MERGRPGARARLRAGRFPLATRVGNAAAEDHQAAHDPVHAFEFGLERLLDGIEALVAGRQSSSG